jgi:hypothetical protein
LAVSQPRSNKCHSAQNLQVAVAARALSGILGEIFGVRQHHRQGLPLCSAYGTQDQLDQQAQDQQVRDQQDQKMQDCRYTTFEKPFASSQLATRTHSAINLSANSCKRTCAISNPQLSILVSIDRSPQLRWCLLVKRAAQCQSTNNVFIWRRRPSSTHLDSNSGAHF